MTANSPLINIFCKITNIRSELHLLQENAAAPTAGHMCNSLPKHVSYDITIHCTLVPIPDIACGVTQSLLPTVTPYSELSYSSPPLPDSRCFPYSPLQDVAVPNYFIPPLLQMSLYCADLLIEATRQADRPAFQINHGPRISLFDFMSETLGRNPRANSPR